MRSNSLSSLAGTAAILCLAASAAIAACSGDTVVNNNGNGSGGQGGEGTTTTTSGTTTTTTSGTTTTTTTGPGNTCEQGCAHAAECGLDICSLANIDCTNPQFDCPAQCLLDATCAQIATIPSGNNMDPALQGCLFLCQGGGQGGGGPGQECQNCVVQSCASVLQSCSTQDCQDWGQCALNCADSQCLTDCNNQFPTAEPYYTQVYGCLCASCDMACATLDPCSQPGGGTGGGGGAGGSP